MPNQYEFYRKNVEPRLDEAENRKAYVIISDAFRYEAAQELTPGTQRQVPLRGQLTSQLGVLPSYTALGMASLLPHKTLAYKPNGECPGGWQADRLDRISGTTFLHGRTAWPCKADELMAMKKEEGREFVAGKKVVYIYHDAVDAIGDEADDREATPSKPCGRRSTNWRAWSATSSTT